MSIYEARQLDTSGNLGPLKETCITHAQKTFFARIELDNDPAIVQMILFEEKVSHWYYRSEKWVDQPYFIPSRFLQPYCGPVDDAPVEQYGPGTYEVDKSATNFALKRANKHK